MAGAVRSSSSSLAATRPLTLRSFFTYRVFVSAIFTLLFLASLSVLLSQSSSSDEDPDSIRGGGSGELTRSSSFGRRSFLSLPYPVSASSAAADALHHRLALLSRHAHDHLALIHAYSSLARRLKLASSRSLSTFQNLSLSFSDLASRVSSTSAAVTDEDALRLLEKEAKEKIKTARQVISESKESFDTQLKIQKLRDTIFAVHEQLNKAKKLGALSSQIAADSTPKSIHCLNMRLMGERINNPKKYKNSNPNSPDLVDPALYHYAIFSDNVIAVSVVVNSAIKNAEEPYKHVFHVVTDKMYVAAMQVWFARRPPAAGARVEVRSASDFAAEFLNGSYSPLIRMVEGGRRDLNVLKYLRFYLPDLFPKLRKIVLLEDDVVVQKDLAGLFRMDLDGKVNGAVEMCFGGFRRYNKYMNFSNLVVRERFSPRACAWGFGVNVFDLDAWRREQCTEQFHWYQSLNEDGTLWNPGTVLPAGLMTFYTTTKPLEKTWHAMGLGYNPSVSQDEIRNAAVIHFNGNMKPWLDVAMNQYKHLWTKYVDTEMEFLPLCNFGL